MDFFFWVCVCGGGGGGGLVSGRKKEPIPVKILSPFDCRML